MFSNTHAYDLFPLTCIALTQIGHFPDIGLSVSSGRQTKQQLGSTL